MDDAAAFGVQLGYRVGEGEIELLYARQDTQLQTADLFTGAPVFDLALETWQIGGTYLFGDDDARARPFVAVGLGLTRLLPEPAGLSDETRFSASFGAGVKLWLGRHFGIRLEGRGFFTVLDSDSRTLLRLRERVPDPHDGLGALAGRSPRRPDPAFLSAAATPRAGAGATRPPRPSA